MSLLINRKKLESEYGLSVCAETLRIWERDRDFPARVHLTTGTAVWLRASVESWLATKMGISRNELHAQLPTNGAEP